jgi:hypothetical protein
MDAITAAVEKLRTRPEVQFEAGEGFARVLPADDQGFSVSIHSAGRRFTVSFSGWHEDFEQPEEALDCFFFGLSESCRLRVTFAGRFAYRWTLESRESGVWREDSTTGLLLFPFWRKRIVNHLQNHFIKVEQ